MRSFHLFGALIAGASICSAASVSVETNNHTDFNSLVWDTCYNVGLPVDNVGLNCTPPGFVQGGYLGNPPVALATVIGTTDTTGLLTAASEKDTLSNSRDGQSASSYAAADLSDGSLHATASASYGSSALAIADLQDLIHFTVNGAGATTVTPIVVSWELDGSIGIFPGGAGTAYEEAASYLVFGTGGVASDVFLVDGIPTIYAPGSGAGGWASFYYTANTENQVRFYGVYDLMGPSATVAVNEKLSANGQGGGWADFGNTSQVGLILPSNVTYTSDSGVFLTAATPEPASWALGGLGLALLGGLSRRKR